MATVFIIVTPQDLSFIENTVEALRDQYPIVEFVFNEIDKRKAETNWWEQTQAEIYACSAVLLFVPDLSHYHPFITAQLDIAKQLNKRIIGIGERPDITLPKTTVWMPTTSSTEDIADTLSEVLHEESRYHVQLIPVPLRNADTLPPPPNIPSNSKKLLSKTLQSGIVTIMVLSTTIIIGLVLASDDDIVSFIAQSTPTPQESDIALQSTIDAQGSGLPPIEALTPTPSLTMAVSNTPTETHMPTATATMTASNTPTETHIPTVIATMTVSSTPTETLTPMLDYTNTDTDDNNVHDTIDECPNELGEPETNGCIYTGTISTTGAQFALVRTEANRTSEVLHRIANGTVVRLIGISIDSEWYKVRFTDQGIEYSGWIFNTLISTSYDDMLPRR